MNELHNNLDRIRERIRMACMKTGRDPREVQLLLATKTVAASPIRTAIAAGYPLIAENRIQELKEKHAALQDIPHINHFIGHLQTNKVKELLRYDVACLQSLDRIELAEKLQQRLAAENRTLDVLIQVNTSGESSKFGVHPDAAVALVRQIANLPALKIRGLMTIGLLSSDNEKVRNCFRLLYRLRQEIAGCHIPGVVMQELSMGMSGDLEAAIAEGATIVRVGTAVFGQRNTPDSFYWNEQL